MTLRVLQKAGMFRVSKPGFHAEFASGDQLLLDLSINKHQLVKIGLGGGTVNFAGFTVRPLVFIYHFSNSGLWSGGSPIPAYIRPYPFNKADGFNAICFVSSSQLVFSGGDGNQFFFMIFREPAP